MDTLRAADTDRVGVPVVEERTRNPADLPPTRAPGRCACTDRLPCLLFASDVEEPAHDPCAGADAAGRAGKARHDSNGRGLDTDGGWTLAGDAAAHTAGQRRSGRARPPSNQLAYATSAPHQSGPDRLHSCPSSARFVVKTFGLSERNFNGLPCA